jgi:hypothetical protein
MDDLRVRRARRHGRSVAAAAGAALSAVMATGCAGHPATARGSVISCVGFGAGAIRRHVVVNALPAACRGLSQTEVNLAVNRALHAAAAVVHGKAAQRRLIGSDRPYLAHLVRAAPAASRPGAAPLSGPVSHVALSFAALAAWLVTVGLGTAMMARWITRIRRHRPGQARRRWPARNLGHFSLAVVSLLVWIGYLATGITGLAWAACGLLLPAAGLGMTLVILASRRPAMFVVAAHIGAAFITILLAVLAAAGSG